MNVLLVHGFWDRNTSFRHLQKRLETAGHACFAPVLHPRDARDGLPDLAQKLAKYVRQNLPAGTPLAIIGFSMGCLVSLAYLKSQCQENPAMVRAFFAISGPLHGSLTAWLYPGKGAQDMRPGSRFLRELHTHDFGIPIHSYYTPLDLMVLPATSSRLPQARELRVFAPWHRAMLRHPSVAQDIIEQLKGFNS